MANGIEFRPSITKEVFRLVGVNEQWRSYSPLCYLARTFLHSVPTAVRATFADFRTIKPRGGSVALVDRTDDTRDRV